MKEHLPCPTRLPIFYGTRPLRSLEAKPSRTMVASGANSNASSNVPDPPSGAKPNICSMICITTPGRGNLSACYQMLNRVERITKLSSNTSTFLVRGYPEICYKTPILRYVLNDPKH